MPYEELNQLSLQEIKARKRKCSWQGCRHKAFLRDWTGYENCLFHWYKSLRYGSGEGCKWFFIKTTKIF